MIYTDVKHEPVALALKMHLNEDAKIGFLNME